MRKILDKDELNCNDFGALAYEIAEFKIDMLFSYEEAGTSPIAMQHYLQALSYLELAGSVLRTAELHQMLKQ